MTGEILPCKRLLGCLAVWVLGSVSAVAQTYSLVQLSTLGGSQSFGTGINNAGQAVGYSYTDSSNLIFHATLWSGYTPTDLGTLGGKLSEATGINNAGIISGDSETATAYHAVIWKGTAQTDLGTQPSWISSGASGINNSGQVVGSSSTSAAQVATIWNGTTPTSLYGFAGGSSANGINNAGEVVGSSATGTGFVATVWNGTAPTALGTLGNGSESIGYGINDSGQVVGSICIDSGNTIFHATLWNGTTPKDLGTLGGNTSVASAINNYGEVTGHSQTLTAIKTSTGVPITSAAFLYSNGVMTDLNSLIDQSDPLYQHVVLDQGSGINDNGWVIANGIELTTGNVDAFLVIPVRFLPRTLTFSDQAVGTQSAPQSVSITNTGTNPFAVTSISAAAGFSQQNDCPISLAAGGVCTIQVTSSPVTSGPQSGLLHITSGSANLTVALSGSAFIPISLNASATTVTVGLPVTLTWASTSLATCTATGGVTGDGWAGNISYNGSQTVTESMAGQYTYTLQCKVGGVPVQEQVVVTDTVLAASLSASPTTLTTGQSTTVTWSSTNASACTASGGGAGDGWAGVKAASGSATATESAAGSITFTITCIAGPQSAQASAPVLVSNPPSGGGGSPPSGGGGAVDLLSLIALSGAFGLRRPRDKLTR